MDRVEGGCLCGAVRIMAEGAPDRVGLCHLPDGDALYATTLRYFTTTDKSAELPEGSTGAVGEAIDYTIVVVNDGTVTVDDVTVDDEVAADALDHTVIIKLNGGLGTSMGLDRAKSLLPVRNGKSFLDIIVGQVRAAREQHGARLPLLFMDSFNTRDDTLEALEQYPDVQVDGLPLDFLQNKEPKLLVDGLAPVSWPKEPDLEWCPPGHGDVYVALAASGLLDRMRAAGIRYAFISNSDNLGATCDPDIAAWMVAEGIPFAVEVAERTLNDRKGGHLAVRRSDGQLVLRESVMVVDDDQEHFQDIRRHQWFNTNNLWVDLDRLDQLLRERDGDLGLPIIVNRKTVDPTRPDSTPVIQIESAMGSAVEAFEGSVALRVPRSRFRPVKTTNELLLLRSDVFELDERWRVVSTIDRGDPTVRLDPTYKLIHDFDARFPQGVPSLRECTSLQVTGDVTFGADVRAVGDVEVVATEPATLPEGARLEGQVELPR